MKRPTPYASFALELSRLAPVFPLRPGTIEPYDGTNGFYDATRDPEVIARIARAYPHANVGLATGNGLVVIDDDSYKGGELLARLEAEAGPLPPTFTVSTPGKGAGRGRHLYYAYHGHLPTKHRFGMDVQAAGAYVVAPGSVKEYGSYDCIDHRAPVELPEPIAEWLRKLSKQPTRSNNSNPIESQSEAPAVGSGSKTNAVHSGSTSTGHRLQGQRRGLSRRTWRLIREGLRAGEHPERDSLLFSVVLAMVRARWTLGQASKVLLNPKNRVSEKLLEKGSVWAERELARSWQRACDEVVEHERLCMRAEERIGTLSGRGKAGKTDRRLLMWMVDVAFTHPQRCNLQEEGTVITLEIDVSKRHLAKHLDISDKTVQCSVSRLVKIGVVTYLSKGTLAAERRIPSRLLVTL